MWENSCKTKRTPQNTRTIESVNQEMLNIVVLQRDPASDYFQLVRNMHARKKGAVAILIYIVEAQHYVISIFKFDKV